MSPKKNDLIDPQFVGPIISNCIGQSIRSWILGIFYEISFYFTVNGFAAIMAIATNQAKRNDTNDIDQLFPTHAAHSLLKRQTNV